MPTPPEPSPQQAMPPQPAARQVPQQVVIKNPQDLEKLLDLPQPVPTEVEPPRVVNPTNLHAKGKGAK
jgi:hypothetical protein